MMPDDGIGLPHSGIPGSTPACGSPRLIAAYHALHRLLVPRHPPPTLSSLTHPAAQKTATVMGDRFLPVLHYRLLYSVVKELAAVRRFPPITRRGTAHFLGPTGLVEMSGFEPPTPCLQSRCSPS